MAGCILHIDLDAFFVSVEQALDQFLAEMDGFYSSGGLSSRELQIDLMYLTRPYCARAALTAR
jgi:nucleotidyltransferase/DNA polymerase involved in DNA repair